MTIHFEKYHGTGNDFIIIDDREHKVLLTKDQIENLCDRRFGIGADGLLLLRNKPGHDFEMVYYNSDGLPGSMCGNGGRCIIAFACRLGLIDSSARFLAADGEHEASIISREPMVVRLKMSDVKTVETDSNFYFLNTGSPHVVVFSEHVSEIDIVKEGRMIRYSDQFKVNGTNVNFIEETNGELFVRTYERGVEEETLSCGTGVTAAVLAAVKKGMLNPDLKSCTVRTPGGTLKVYFLRKNEGFEQVFLEGPATLVYKGSVEV